MASTANTSQLARQVEQRLREHSGVNDVAVADVDGKLRAYVVPKEQYLDEVLGRAESERKRLLTWSKTYDLMHMGKQAATAPVAFNTAGWNSSYTHQPIPAEEMREWVELTCANILKLQPREVLEIGCGPGLLLLRIAPHCTRYVATDFAGVALKSLRKQMAEIGGEWPGVELLQRSAENLEGFESESFDTVVINSVVQHFPNLGYLNRVMDKVIGLIRPNGTLFIGDSRNLLLLEMYALSVELHHSKEEDSVQELRDRVKKRIEREEQLVLSPAYFLSLLSHPRVRLVEVSPKHGTINNELNRYRFDVTIRIDGSESVTSECTWLDWKASSTSVESLRALLDGRPERIGIRGIANARLTPDIAVLNELAASDTASVKDLRAIAKDAEANAIWPEQLWQLGESAGYEATLSWNSCRENGSYDAVFSRFDMVSTLGSIAWPSPPANRTVCVTNAPSQLEFRQRLTDELTRCGCEVTLVDAIPRNSTGAPDADALRTAASY